MFSPEYLPGGQHELAARQVELNVRDVKESVFVAVFLVDTRHECGRRRKDLVNIQHMRLLISSCVSYLVDEDEDGLLRRELDALADDIYELANGEVCWDEVLLLVDSCDVRLLDLLADDLCESVN